MPAERERETEIERARQRGTSHEWRGQVRSPNCNCQLLQSTRCNSDCFTNAEFGHDAGQATIHTDNPSEPAGSLNVDPRVATQMNKRKKKRKENERRKARKEKQSIDTMNTAAQSCSGCERRNGWLVGSARAGGRGTMKNDLVVAWNVA